MPGEFSFIRFMYPHEIRAAIRRLKLTAMARGGLTDLQARYFGALLNADPSHGRAPVPHRPKEA